MQVWQEYICCHGWIRCNKLLYQAKYAILCMVKESTLEAKEGKSDLHEWWCTETHEFFVIRFARWFGMHLNQPNLLDTEIFWVGTIDLSTQFIFTFYYVLLFSFFCRALAALELDHLCRFALKSGRASSTKARKSLLLCSKSNRSSSRKHDIILVLATVFRANTIGNSAGEWSIKRSPARSCY